MEVLKHSWMWQLGTWVGGALAVLWEQLDLMGSEGFSSLSHDSKIFLSPSGQQSWV